MASTLAHNYEAKPESQPGYIENARAGAIIDDTQISVQGEDEVNKYVWYLVCIAGIAGFLFGWDTAVVGGALGNIGSDLGHVLNSVEQEWAVAALSAGALVSSLVGGTASDKYGRKPVLIFGDFCFIVGGIIIITAYSLAQFIVGRVVMGFGVGIAAVTCAVYIGEVSPSKYRGRLIAVQSVLITGGQMIAYAVAAGLQHVRHGWRILFALAIPFAIVQAVGMHWLPESPRFSVLQGRGDLAIGVLKKVYPKASEDEIALKLHAIQIYTGASEALKAKHPTLLGRVRAVLTTPRYLRCTFCACVVFFGQQLCGWNSFLYYSSTLFGAAGFSNPSAVGILIAGVNTLMTIFSMFTMDRFGRRRIFLVGIPIMIISLAIAAMAFHFMTESTAGKLIDGADYPRKWVGLMIGMMVIFIFGYAPSLGTLAYTTIELIPLEVRGIGSAIAVACQWGGNLIISSSFLTMLNNLGPAGTYGLFGAFCLLTFLWIVFCYPEPAGLTLEQTGTLFDTGFGVKKAGELRRANRAQAKADAERANIGGLQRALGDVREDSFNKVE